MDAHHEELRRIARRQAAAESPGQAPWPTSLVNEACLRLFGDEPANWASRRHFFATAARIMRNIRVDDARKRKRLKRGGGRRRVSLEAAAAGQASGADRGNWADDPGDVLALDEALARLEQIDPRKAELVNLRFFAGLTREQIGEILGIAPRTVDKEWHFARAWLRRALSDE